ncbi:hypothetical protein HDV01_000593 [Terramyces sp. JEL0728]|nr:hypothetical protein HDV01_000593 [Terramyces sp. JEL0728]
MSAFQGLRRGIISVQSHDPSLATLIEEEKDCIELFRKCGREVGETSKYITKWGDSEHFDLKDMTSHFSMFAEEIQKILYDISGAYGAYREKLKDIKKKAEELHELDKKYKAANEKFKKAQKKGEPYDKLESDSNGLHKQLLDFECIYEASKRSLYKEAVMLQYNGWADFAVKASIIAQFGKEMANQIPQGAVGPGDDLPPYTGSQITKQIKEDFLRTMKECSGGSHNLPKRSESSLSQSSFAHTGRQSVQNSPATKPVPNANTESPPTLKLGAPASANYQSLNQPLNYYSAPDHMLQPGQYSNAYPNSGYPQPPQPPYPQQPQPPYPQQPSYVPPGQTIGNQPGLPARNSIKHSGSQQNFPPASNLNSENSYTFSVPGQYQSLRQDSASNVSGYQPAVDYPDYYSTVGRNSDGETEVVQCQYCGNYIEGVRHRDHVESRCQSYILRLQPKRN